MTHRSRRLSLLEVMISVTLLAGVLGLFLSIVSNSGDVLASTHAVADCMERAESALARVHDDLRNARTSSLQVTASGQQAGAPLDTISYTTLAAPAPADPFSPVWNERRVLRFEAQPNETPLNNTDDDGDYRVDEGVLVLYRDPPSPATRIAVLCVDVLRFEVELTPAVPDGQASVQVSLRLQQPIRAAARTLTDHQQLTVGAGPRAEHTARRRIPLPN